MSLLVKGSSFPASPSSGDPFFRDDLGLWCYYDGTRWLTQPKVISQERNSISSNGEVIGRLPSSSYSVYIPSFNVVTTTQVSTTNDGSNYWTVTVQITNSTYSSATTIHTFTTAADTADAWTAHDDAPDSQTPTENDGYLLIYAKTGSPGAIRIAVGFEYQLIIT